jgi:inositol oxygenase
MPVEIECPIDMPKAAEEFRNYKDSDRQAVVDNHYRLMRTHQSVEFVDRMMEKYSFDKPRATMSIREAFRILETYVDSSDPDVSLPNLVHMLQTAEGIRKAGFPDWMQLVGLIHDMGKIMFLWGTEADGQVGTGDGAQWALGGDTWVVGCKIPDTTVFPHYNELNADETDPRYNTEYGIYEPNCGFDNLKLAYGHDEYLYRMVIANGTTIPVEGLAMIRYHSCYPWHTGGSYRHLMNEQDYESMKWILEFNKFDLYTKDQAGLTQTVDELWPYYQGLIDKYFPNSELKW